MADYERDYERDDLFRTGSDAHATVYTRSALSAWYDVYVLGFNMSYVWGCPTSSVLLPFFSEHFSRNHLDCGVATGYIPATALNCFWRKYSRHRLTLLDLNPNPLRAARARVLSVATDTEVDCVEADVTAPPPRELVARRFDSVSMFNLFHCMPGGRDKFRAFGTMAQLISDDGVLVGSTVLGIQHTTWYQWFTRFYLRWYNHWWGVFNNWDDTRDDVEIALRESFEEVETWTVGMMLLFRATRPRRDASKTLIDV